MSRRMLWSRLGVISVLVLAIVLLLAPAAPAFAYPDVPAGHAYEQAIEYLSGEGIVGGYLNGKFGLNDPVKRAQFAKMIVGTLYIDPADSTATRFTDLGTPDANGYPHKFVQAAYDAGITYGTNATQTLFEPGKYIRRDQVVTMIVRGANGIYPGALVDPLPGIDSLFDGVPEPHGENLRIAEYNGLLDGLLGMGPGWDVTANATRGEVAQMLWNLLNVIGEGDNAAEVFVYADGSGDYPTLEAAVADVDPGTTIYLGGGTFTLRDTLLIDFDCDLVGNGTQGAEATTVRFAGLVADVYDCSFYADGIRFVSTATNAASDAMNIGDAEVDLYDCYFTGGNNYADEEGDGLYIYGSSSVYASGCVFTGNDLDGVEVDDESELLLEDSECTDNGRDGVTLWADSYGELTGNDCSGNGDSGIVSLDYAILVASYNICSDNFYDGISCHDDSEVTLENNTCEYNDEDGITLDEYAVGTLSFNTCSYNGYYGIDLEGFTYGIIEDNACLHNDEAGIYFGEDSDGEATGNECAFNYYGILIDEGLNPTIGTNDLHDNTYSVVRLTSI